MSGMPDLISACSSAKNFSAMLAREEIEVGLADEVVGLDAHAIRDQLVAAVKRLCASFA